MFNDMMRAEIWLQEKLETQQGIEDLAQRLGYSSSQIRRNFKRCFGLSPSAYRDQLRLERAVQLLGHTYFSIYEIASQCGYQNHSAFSRAFLRRYHISPREFRRSERQRLSLLRHDMTQEYPFRIDHAQRQHAVVTRLYQHGPKRESNIENLPEHETLQALPDKLRNGCPIVIIHGNHWGEGFSRADLGVQVDEGVTDELAIPLPFRTLSLPAYRYASVVTDNLGELGSIIDFLLAKALPQHDEFVSGLPPRLLWRKTKHRKSHKSPDSVELRLPLYGSD
ncbi:hypothetical protein L861_18110 [Litchfieldella anticariensis FP35 = DSM 16096]|uniref:HTH araC/xylS-type domain-containing protein n=1 Tax=Litchfieldella anticariensis (strain DSM 16096 / CECT 5854 / CIP 108499 / LMG 22089 / FP35) TaxID=1121939 RepID=S2KSI6_LITA3|nr:AraC family transcriptional regulator [Halomonas anticariensis]EPC03453.1 hypothetical protein L861_18110 [Halomonas anticariensis FP35 = DSM 16096]